MRSNRSRLAGLASALLALGGACASPTDEVASAPAIALTIVSGSGQTGAAGSELPSPLQVKVTDNGKILKDYLVTFRVISGGGRMYAGTALTDSRGIAQDWWRLGPTAGAQRVDVVAVDPLTGVKQNFGSFTATATSVAVLSLTPASQSFGSVGVGTPGSGQIFTISNTGGAASGALLIEIEGAHPGDFGTSNSTCTGTLNPGGTCNVTVTFAPTATGARTASLKASASPGGSALASLSGTGLAGASLLVSPTPFDFGDVPAEFGSTSTPQAFTVTNSGGTSGQLVVFLTGSHPGDFEILSDGCSGQSLPGGGFCEINVRFRPTAQGERSGALNVLGKPAETAQANLEGTGVVPHLSLTPQDVNFGSVPVGQSAVQPMTVTNDGQAAAQIAAVDAGGNPNFSITNNLCPAVLAVSATCSFTVVFQPTSVGLKSSTVVVAGNAAATAVVIGAGVTPANLVISPNPHGFGAAPVGTTSSATLTVINTGGVTSGTVSFAIDGTNAADFAEIAGGTCSPSTSLAAGESCTVVVRFSPTETGARTAILQATASPGGTASADLTGTGLAPAELLVTPYPQEFGSVTVGGSSSPFLFTVTNIGAAVSGAVSLSLTGTNASDFELAAGGTCVSGATILAPGGSCTVNVIFTPTATGAKQAALRAAATPGGISVAQISGTGN